MPGENNPVLDFMSWYLKLFIVGINRKRYELTCTDERLYAINNSRNTIWAILFYGLGSLFIFSGLTELHHLSKPVDTGFIIVFFIVHPAFGILSLRQFLWLVNGKQIMIVEEGNLTLSKKGTFFTFDKTYPLESIKNIRRAIDESQLSSIEKIVNRASIFRKAFLVQIFGEVLFDYQYNVVKIFNDMDDNEKEQLIDELLKFQQKLVLVKRLSTDYLRA